MKKLTLLLALVFTSNVAFAAPFSDTSNHTYQTAIDLLYEQKVIQGDSGKNTFRPDDGINRAEITKIIVLASTTSSLTNWDKDCFPDVKQGQWYTKYVCYAKEQGWIKGYTDGKFKPDQNVSNFEGMKIAAKAQNIDFTEGNPWYEDLVNILSENNLIPYTIHEANANLTRAEMSDLIVRLQKNAAGTLDAYLGTRADTVITLETINDGLNLSKFTPIRLCAESC